MSGECQSSDPPPRSTEWGARAASYAAYAVPKNRPYARDLVAAVGIAEGERVLDVATGPGVVAIEAARSLAGSGEVVATDLAPEWEPFVGLAAAGLGNVRFRVMPAEALALPDDAFDVAFCQFGLMFVSDPAVALAEISRVLRPGGRLGVAVWSTPDKVAHFATQRALVAAMGNPPAFCGPSPLSLGAPGLIDRLVAEAGFVGVTTCRVTHAIEVHDADREWERLAGEPRFAAHLCGLDEERIARIRRTTLDALAPYRSGGIARLPSEAILVTGSTPAGTADR